MPVIISYCTKGDPLTKYIVVASHWFRELVASGDLRVLKVKSDNNWSEITTKGL